MAKFLITSTTSSRPERAPAAHRWSRRTLFAALPATFLAGCSSDPTSADNYGALLLNSRINPFAGPQMVSKAQAASIRYASIGLQVGGASQLLLVLAARSGPTHLWTSASHIALQTHSGRIIRTAGLEHNLSDTTFSGEDPVASGLTQARGGEPLQRRLDFADQSLFGIDVSSRFSVPQYAQIEILGAAIKTLHVTERCHAQRLNWTFTNEYWVDIDSGLVWQSIQTIHPDLEPLTIQTLRPPVS